MKYGSKNQLTDEVIAQVEADIAELLQKANQKNLVPGKMDRFMLDNTKVDQAYTLLAQVYIMTIARQLKHTLNQLTLQ